MRRRDWLGLSAAGAIGFYLQPLGAQSPARPLIGSSTGGQAHRPGSHYGHHIDPPDGIKPGHLDHILPQPAPVNGEVRHFEFTVTEHRMKIAHGVEVDAWSYNGTVPGPVIRVNEGDEINLTLHNKGSHPHNIHFHGRHDISQDGIEPIKPGASQNYRFRAEPFGVHPYHCHVAPVDRHMARGLFGTMIVDPVPHRPIAREFLLVLHAWDTNDDSVNEFYAWNGLAGYYSLYPLKVKVGELVRIYLVNMTEYEPMASFHLHAEMFHLFRTGTKREPDEWTDVVGLGPSERCFIEFRLPKPGRYMFHPHHSKMAANGAMGWIVAV